MKRVLISILFFSAAILLTGCACNGACGSDSWGSSGYSSNHCGSGCSGATDW